jgi:hypothetical protein
MFNGVLQFISTVIGGSVSTIGNAVASARFEAGYAGWGGGAFATGQELDTTNMSVFSFVWAC